MNMRLLLLKTKPAKPLIGKRVMTSYAFYILAGLTLGAALAVVLSGNPVRSVLWLIVTFLGGAGLWLITGAEFLAFILILVYVGAVMTLFLFVIMMLNISHTEFKRSWLKTLGSALITISAVVAMVGYLLWLYPMEHALSPGGGSGVTAIGLVLYTDYAYPFVLAGLLLLVAIIAAITLAHRPERGGKRQHPPSQMQVQKHDRLRMVSAEPNESIDVRHATLDEHAP